MTMIRGADYRTAFRFADSVDLAELGAMEVWLKGRTTTLHFTNIAVDADRYVHILVPQEDTIKFADNEIIKIQMRYIYRGFTRRTPAYVRNVGEFIGTGTLNGSEGDSYA
jgi:hypothetical protein